MSDSSRFSWLPEAQRRQVEDALARPMPRGRGALRYRHRPPHLDRAEVDGRRHLVFVCYYAYPSTVKKSIVLRATGRYHTTLLACCVREDLEAERWFDAVYELEHYTELFELLADARPASVTACIQPALLGAVVLEACTLVRDTVRVILDVTDSNYYMRRDPNHPDSLLERPVLARADAFVHKMPPAAIHALRQAWDLDPQQTPDYLAHCLPMPALFQDAPPPPSPTSSPAGPWKIVYAGGIMPWRAALRDGHEHMLMDPIVEATAKAGIGLTFYANLNARDMFWEEQDRYFDLEARCPLFSLRQGVPFHRLPAEIADFHYGLLYDQKALSSWPHEGYVHNMSTKIFSYFEAGLPLLVYEDMEYVCQLVREHGLGLVYSLDRLDELPALLARADYPTLRENVRRYRESHALETLLPTLEAIYG
ncbi:hypothetical protein [Megalodesulfovibrio paquesii]